MSTFMERWAEAIDLTAIAEVCSRDAAKLDKAIKQRVADNAKDFATVKLLALTTGIPVVEPKDFELERMQTRLDALWERNRQARLRLQELERTQAEQAVIKVISTNDKGAQIVIHYFRDDGKKVSFTRHVHRAGLNWVGLSTLTTQKVTYRQPGTALVEAA